MFARTRKRKNNIVTITDGHGLNVRPRKGISDRPSLTVPALPETVVVDMGYYGLY